MMNGVVVVCLTDKMQSNVALCTRLAPVFYMCLICGPSRRVSAAYISKFGTLHSHGSIINTLIVAGIRARFCLTQILVADMIKSPVDQRCLSCQKYLLQPLEILSGMSVTHIQPYLSRYSPV
jgi:hypothetical protein